MQKLLNNPEDLVEEAVEGYLLANSQRVASTGNPRVIKSLWAGEANRVGIVTGGGSGHKPAFVGYLGRHFVDAVAIGEVFSSPPAQAFLDAFREADGGAGVACLYGNYAGDNMNVRMAMDLAGEAGIEVRTVVADDDVPSAPSGQRENRRGVAGEVLMWKIGGAAAALGGDLQSVTATAQRAIDNTRSVGVGLAPCTIPAVGRPNFQIEAGKMEMGIGHHGEPGIEVVDLAPSREIAERMVGLLLPDLPFRRGDKVAVLVSGLGATPPSELFLFFRDVHRLLERAGLDPVRRWVGDYFTSLDMSGVTLTLLKLDAELTECLDHEADSWGWTQQIPSP